MRPVHTDQLPVGCSSSRRPSRLQQNFPRVERFGVPAGRSAFDASKPHQAFESRFGEPAFAALAAKRRHQQANLLPPDGSRQLDEDAGATEITIEFRNLVLQNAVITERVPRELRKHAVVLMRVAAEVGEHDMGLCGLELLENALERGTVIREMA